MNTTPHKAMLAATLSAALLALGTGSAAADVFPPSKFPLTAYSQCTIDGARINLSMSYRDNKKNASRRDLGKVYASGPLTNGKLTARAVDSATGTAKTAESHGTYRNFSANADFRAHRVSAGSTVTVTVTTANGTCTTSMTAQ